MANQILAGAVVSAGAVIAGVDADNPPVTSSGSGSSTSSSTGPTSASYMVVGAPYSLPATAGAAYLFDATDFSAAGVKLTAPDAANFDQFGESVSVSNGRVFIGSKGDDDRGGNTGSVYVYDATNPTAAPTKLIGTDITGGDQFGIDVASFGDTLVVGAWRDDDGGNYTGSAWVYDASDLSAAPTKLTSPDPEAYDYLGRSVAVTDSHVIAGAYGNKQGGSQTGAVYVWDKNDLSAVPTKLLPHGPSSMPRHLGYSVSANGSILVAGNHSDDDYQGAVFVYDLNDLSAQATKLTPPDGDDYDFFGMHKAGVSDDVIVIGSKGDDGTGVASGSAYVYDANDLSAAPTKLTLSSQGSNDEFGVSADVIGDMIVISAQYDDPNQSGTVFVYDRNDLSAAPTEIRAADALTDIRFGASVALG